jgi:hypothetical protein
LDRLATCIAVNGLPVTQSDCARVEVVKDDQSKDRSPDESHISKQVRTEAARYSSIAGGVQ